MLRLGRYTLIVAAAWAMVSLAAETVFRVFGDRPTLDLAGLYAPLPDGLYKLRGNVDTTADWSSGHLSVHTDELGLRCDDSRRLAVRPGETVDFMLLGDSQGFGNGLSFDDTLAGSTANAAVRDGVKIVNASVGGHSAASQLAVAEWLATTHGVRARTYVVLATPSILQGGDHLARARVGGDGRLYDLRAGSLAEMRVWVRTHMVTYARIRDALRNSNIGTDTNRDAPTVFGFYARAAEPTFTQSFYGFVARLKEFAATQGARVQLVYVPLTIEADFEPIRTAAAAQGVEIDRDLPLRVCTLAAERAGVPLTNLRPVLADLHRRGDPLHLRGDFHYDRELSRACGTSLWASLRGSPAQPPLASSH